MRPTNTRRRSPPSRSAFAPEIDHEIDQLAKVSPFIRRERKESGWKRMEVSWRRGRPTTDARILDVPHLRHRCRRRCRRRCPSLLALWSPLMRPIVRALTALTRIGKKYLRYLRARPTRGPFPCTSPFPCTHVRVCILSETRLTPQAYDRPDRYSESKERGEKERVRRRRRTEQVGRGGSIGTSLTAANNPRAWTNI